MPRSDKKPTEPAPIPGQWRAPAGAPPLIGKHFGWPVWFSIAIALSALIALWAFTPGGRDRWVKKDGAIACQGATEIEDIQSSQSTSSRRFTVEDFVAEKKCVPLFADDRVRIREIGEDGSKVLVVLGTSGRSMWMQLVDLKLNSPTLLTMPWLWKEEPPPVSGFEEKAKNPFDRFDDPEDSSGEKVGTAPHVTDGEVGLHDVPTFEAALPPRMYNPQGNFINVKLAGGVSLDLPRAWRVLGAQEMNIIETSTEAALDLTAQAQGSFGDRRTLLAANSMPLSTYAAIRINAVPAAAPGKVTAGGLQEAAANITKQLPAGLAMMLGLQQGQLLDFQGARVDQLAGHPALVISYRRSGLKGPVIVELSRVFTATQELSVNLSYREAEAPLWKTTIARIRNSITIADGKE